MRTLSVVMVTVMALSACGGNGSSSLSDEEQAWCIDNSALVDDTATQLGLLDFVDTWYEAEGDGIGPDGEPNITDRNIEVSEELNRRNQEDADALFDDLFARYLEHPDGEQACAAAFAESV